MIGIIRQIGMSAAVLTALSGAAEAVSAPGDGTAAPGAMATAERIPPRMQLGLSGLPVPRFVSLKANRANLRAGPSSDHRILFQYEGLAGMPLMVTAETEMWRRVRDFEGDEGWIHRSLLRAPAQAFAAGERALPLRRSAEDNAAITAYVQPGALGRVQSCDEGWCRVRFPGARGWLPETALWGVNGF